MGRFRYHFRNFLSCIHTLILNLSPHNPVKPIPASKNNAKNVTFPKFMGDEETVINAYNSDLRLYGTKSPTSHLRRPLFIPRGNQEISIIILKALQKVVAMSMPNPRRTKRFPFTPIYKTLQEILADHDLATLGDAYTNLLYSLYLSTKAKKPTGAKASSSMLSQALKQAGLRDFIHSRVDRHKQADAAEALLVYIWLQGLSTITEGVEKLTKHENATKAFGSLLSDAKEKLDLLLTR